MIFVATPFYNFDKEISEKRTAIISKYCGRLLSEGKMCTSPVVFGVTVLRYCHLPSDFSFWDKLSFAALERSDELHVLMINGWVESRGVQEEIKFAKEKNIPIKYIGVQNVLTDGSPVFYEKMDHETGDPVYKYYKKLFETQ